MGGFRALTRHHASNDKMKKPPTRKRTHQQAEEQAAPVEKPLKVISLTSEQENTNAVKFIFDDGIPTNKAGINTLLFEELKTPDHVLIGL